MLTKDQKERLSLLKSMYGEEISKKDAIEALEMNYWDTAMAFEWLKKKKNSSEVSLEEFHAAYDEARKKAVVLPSDRYDTNSESKNAPANRKQRRAAKKEKKSKK
jgi:hypothetical protein